MCSMGKVNRYSVSLDSDIDSDIEELIKSSDVSANKILYGYIRKAFNAESANSVLPEKVKPKSDVHYTKIPVHVVQDARSIVGDIDEDVDSMIRQWIRDGLEKYKNNKEMDRVVSDNVLQMRIKQIPALESKPVQDDTETAKTKQSIRQRLGSVIKR